MVKLVKGKKRELCKFYAYPEEKAMFAAEAKKANLSFSDYVRRILAHREIPTQEKNEAIRDLMSVKADLARLGNLFKLAIDEEPTLTELKLIDEISETHNLLREKIKKL